MKMKLVVCFCCMFVLLCGAAASGQNANVEKAKELWEKVIAAKGGRENLYAIKNLVVSKKSYSPQADKEFQNSKSEELFVMSGKWWSWSDDRPGFTLDIWQYDFEREIGYEVGERRGLDVNKPYKTDDASQGKSAEELRLRKLENDRFHYIRRLSLENQLIYLMETGQVQPRINALQVKEVKGEKTNVIEVLFEDLKFEYYIDPKTSLPFYVKKSVYFDYRKAYGAEDGYFLEDYITVGAVKFPQVVKMSKTEKTKTTYQVNVKYKENLFNKPPSIADGQEGWKAKQ